MDVDLAGPNFGRARVQHLFLGWKMKIKIYHGILPKFETHEFAQEARLV